MYCCIIGGNLNQSLTCVIEAEPDSFNDILSGVFVSSERDDLHDDRPETSSPQKHLNELAASCFSFFNCLPNQAAVIVATWLKWADVSQLKE